MSEGRLVAEIPQCMLCGRVWWPLATEYRKAYLSNDKLPELAFCCPECSEREFPRDDWPEPSE